MKVLLGIVLLLRLTHSFPLRCKETDSSSNCSSETNYEINSSDGDSLYFKGFNTQLPVERLRYPTGILENTSTFNSASRLHELPQSPSVPDNQKPLPPLGTPCHPFPAADLTKVYLISFGSMISSQSKRDSASQNKTTINIPVTVYDFSRRWNAQDRNITYLGVVRESGEKFNGVAFGVSDLDTLRRFDRREGLYCREEVDPTQVKLLVNEQSFEGKLPDKNNVQYWIYTVKPDKNKKPTEKCPIVQSYVDIFLSGCREVQKKYGLEGYADDCVKLTKDWKYSWVNDRDCPMKSMPGFKPKTQDIDELLKKYSHESYNRLKKNIQC